MSCYWKKLRTNVIKKCHLLKNHSKIQKFVVRLEQRIQFVRKFWGKIVVLDLQMKVKCPTAHRKKVCPPPQPFRAELFSRRPWKRVCISTVFLIWFTYSLLLHGRYYLFFSLFISSAGPITNPMRRKRGELDNTKSLTHVNSTILLAILRDLETAKGSRVNITFFLFVYF